MVKQGQGASTRPTRSRSQQVQPYSFEAKPLEPGATSLVIHVNGKTLHLDASNLASSIRNGEIQARYLPELIELVKTWPEVKYDPDLKAIIDEFEATGRVSTVRSIMTLYHTIASTYKSLTRAMWVTLTREAHRKDISKTQREVSPLEVAANFAAASLEVYRTVMRRALRARVMATPHPVVISDIEHHFAKAKDVARSKRDPNGKWDAEEHFSGVLRELEEPFNTPRDEAGKFFRDFTEGRADEIMDDGEGRTVDGYVDNVRNLNQLLICDGIDVARKKHHTVRIPDPAIESEHQAYERYLMEIIATNFEQLQKDKNDLGEWRGRLAIYELIIPQINSMEDLEVLKKVRSDIETFVSEFLDQKKSDGVKFDRPVYEETMNKINLIPLVEDANIIVNLREFMLAYHEAGLCISTKIPKLPKAIFELHAREGYMFRWLVGILRTRVNTIPALSSLKLLSNEKLVEALADYCPEARLAQILQERSIDYSKICELWYHVKQENEREKRHDRHDTHRYGNVILNVHDEEEVYRFTDSAGRPLIVQGVALTVKNVEELLDLVKDNERTLRVMVAGSDVPLKSGNLKARVCELLAGNECAKAQKTLDRLTAETGEDEVFATLIAGRGNNTFRGRATPTTPPYYDPNRTVSDALLQLLRYYTCTTLQGVIEDQPDAHLLRPFVSQLKTFPIFYDLLPRELMRTPSAMLSVVDGYKIVGENAGNFVLPDPRNEEMGFLPAEMEATARRIMTLGEIAYLKKIPHVVEAASLMSKRIPRSRPRRKTYSRPEPAPDLSKTPADLVDDHRNAHVYCQQNWPLKKDEALVLCDDLLRELPTSRRARARYSELKAEFGNLRELVAESRWYDVRDKVQQIKEMTQQINGPTKTRVLGKLDEFGRPELQISIPRPISFNGQLMRSLMPPSLLDLEAMVNICKANGPEKEFIDTYLPGLYAHVMSDEVYFYRNYASILFGGLASEIQELITQVKTDPALSDLAKDIQVQLSTRGALPSQALTFILTSKLLNDGKTTDISGNNTLISPELVTWAHEN
ncbi:phosphoenolpyruvate carboxylase, partial [Candidatus Micrarchaeota archaeon]|nr:phosphoenolpyruvate carboxylase [Candidatus Micrarchaeota archaeon]